MKIKKERERERDREMEIEKGIQYKESTNLLQELKIKRHDCVVEDTLRNFVSRECMAWRARVFSQISRDSRSL